MKTTNHGAAGAVSTPDSARQMASEVIGRAQMSPGSVPKLSQAASATKEEIVRNVDAVLLPPGRIKPNRFAPLQSAATDQQKKFQLLLKDIGLQHGNVNPIKVRPIYGDSEVDYEVVFGHRRHRACLLLGLPVLAIVEDVSDKQLFIQGVRENAYRSQNSPYDRGVMFRQALDVVELGVPPLFMDVQELATDSNLDPSLVYKLVKLAELPPVVLNAFPSPSKIQANWGSGLHRAWKNHRELVEQEGLRIAQSGQPRDAKWVYHELTRIGIAASPRRVFMDGCSIRRGDAVVGEMEVLAAAEGGDIRIRLDSGAVDPDVLYQLLMRAVRAHKPPTLETGA